MDCFDPENTGYCGHCDYRDPFSGERKCENMFGANAKYTCEHIYLGLTPSIRVNISTGVTGLWVAIAEMQRS
jgi:hypothetical protein